MSDAPPPYPAPPPYTAHAPPRHGEHAPGSAPRLTALIAVFGSVYTGVAAFVWLGTVFFGMISHRYGRSGGEQFVYVLGEIWPLTIGVVASAVWHAVLLVALRRGRGWARVAGGAWVGLCNAATVALLVWLLATGQGPWHIPALLLAATTVIALTGLRARRRPAAAARPF